MSELKPCPFCGGEARVVKADFPAFTPHNNGYFVVCSNCETEIGLKGMEGGKTYGSFPRENVAAKAWNTRVERTCHREEDQNNWGTMYDDWCSECDEHIKQGANYYPGCGAKVVDDK